MTKRIFAGLISALLIASCGIVPAPGGQPAPNTGSSSGNFGVAPTSIKEGIRVILNDLETELQKLPNMEAIVTQNILGAILFFANNGLPTSDAGFRQVQISLLGSGALALKPLPKGFKAEDTVVNVEYVDASGRYKGSSVFDNSLKIVYLNNTDRLEGYFHGNLKTDDLKTLPVKIHFNLPFPASPVSASPSPSPSPVAATPAKATLKNMKADTCDQGGKLKSANGPATKVNFINKSGSTIKIYWLNYAGTRVHYKTLANGQSHLQGTFNTHPWVITDNAEKCLGIYTATTGNTANVTVE